MANDFTIPPNKIGSSGFVSQEVPGIKFSVPENPDAAAWASLSQSVGDLAQTSMDIDKLEGEQTKVMDQYKAQLQQIAGLDPSMDEKEIENLFRQEQGRLQKEGVIQAYENFTFINEVEKSRAELRLEAFGARFKDQVPMMTNPTNPKSYDDAERDVWASLENEVLVDAAGNDVSFDMTELRTGELIAMTQGMASLRTGIYVAVDEARHERAIQVSTDLFRTNSHAILSSGGPPEAKQQGIQEQFNIAHNAGVTNLNKEFFNTVELWAEEMADTAPLSPSTFATVTETLDNLQTNQYIRPGHLLAPSGSENHEKLEDARDRFLTKWASRQRAEGAAATARTEEREQDVATWVIDEFLAGNLKAEDIPEKLLVAAQFLGLPEPDKIWGKLDAVIKGAGENDALTGTILGFIHHNRLDGEKLEKNLASAHKLLYDGQISLEQYKSILTATESEQRVLGTLGPVAKEFGEEYDKMYSVLEGDLQRTLKQNNRRVQSGIDALTGQPTWITEGGHDDIMSVDSRNKMGEFLSTAIDTAIFGGKFTSTIPEFSEGDLDILKGNRWHEQQISETMRILKQEVIFKETPSGETLTLREFQARKRSIQQQAAAYAQYLGMQQIIALNTPPEGSITEEIQNGKR